MSVTVENEPGPMPAAPEDTGQPTKGGIHSMHALVGGVAHAFTNLLTSTIGHLELALDAIPAESTVRDDLNFALTDARKMAELCHRTISRCGRGVFQMTRLDLRVVLDAAVASLAARVPPRIELRFQPGAWPIWVSGEPSLLQTLTVNLIQNALEATRPDGGTVTVSPLVESIDERFAADHFMGTDLKPGEYAGIEVADTGYGMDAVIVRKAFSPLFSTKGYGRGLGLTEVQGIALIHRGTVAVETEVGRGSTFKVLLPLCEERGAARAATPAAPAGGGAKRRGTVLIIDDEPGVTRYAGRILQRLGFGCFTAGDGPEGLDRFREHADEIDLVLLDVFMPVMDGDEVLKELRRIRPDVKVLLVSGYQQAALTDRFSREDVASLLFKPFATADFVNRVERAMQTTQERKPA